MEAGMKKALGKYAEVEVGEEGREGDPYRREEGRRRRRERCLRKAEKKGRS